MITNVHFTTIYVTDLERAIDFYTNTLELPMLRDSREEGFTWVEVGLPDTNDHYLCICLGKDDALGDWGQSVGAVGVIRFECDDLEKTYAELTAKGVNFVKAPLDIKARWKRWASFADPDGNTFGLTEKERVA